VYQKHCALISYFLHLNKFEIDKLTDVEFETEKNKAIWIAKMLKKIK
jgi:hypothetical protein